MRSDLHRHYLGPPGNEGVPAGWQSICIDSSPWKSLDPEVRRWVPESDYLMLSDLEGRPLSAELPDGQLTGLSARTGLRASLNQIDRRIRLCLDRISEFVTDERQLEKASQGDRDWDNRYPFLAIVASPAEPVGSVCGLGIGRILARAFGSGPRFTHLICTLDDPDPQSWPTALGFLSELMATCYEEPLSTWRPGFAAEIGAPGTGPPAGSGLLPYLVCGYASQDPGRSLDRPRMVGSLLAAAHASHEAQLPLLYSSFGWTIDQMENTTSWSFGNSSRPDGVSTESGVFSSLGFARLSTGFAEFLEYAVSRTARLIVEKLPNHTVEVDEGVLLAIQSWPSSGPVPEPCLPPPQTLCIVEPSSWPRLFEQLLGLGIECCDCNERGAQKQIVENLARNLVEYLSQAAEDEDKLEGEYERVHSQHPPSDHSSLLGKALGIASSWILREDSHLGELFRQGICSYLNKEEELMDLLGDHPDRVATFASRFGACLRAASPQFEWDDRLASLVHPRSDISFRRRYATYSIEQIPIFDESAKRALQVVLEGQLGGGSEWWSNLFAGGAADPQSIVITSRLRAAVHPSVAGPLMKVVGDGWRRWLSAGANSWDSWTSSRPEHLELAIPVTPMVLDQMISGWFVGRLLGRISDPDPSSGFLIACSASEGERSIQFPWPPLSLSGPQLALPENKPYWLPSLLECITLAFALLPEEPQLVDAFDELYRLGDGDCLCSWVIDGDPGPLARGVSPQVSGDSFEERRRELIGALYALSLSFSSLRADVEAKSISDQRSQEMYLTSLFPRYVAALARLEQKVSQLDTIGWLG